MTDLMTAAGFVLSVSGVLLCCHSHRKGLGAVSFILGLALLLAALAATGGAQ